MVLLRKSNQTNQSAGRFRSPGFVLVRTTWLAHTGWRHEIGSRDVARRRLVVPDDALDGYIAGPRVGVISIGAESFSRF